MDPGIVVMKLLNSDTFDLRAPIQPTEEIEVLASYM
jgi:hypothetical protein